MRYMQKYTYLDVENRRARCTFGDEGTYSAILGPAYRKQDKDERREENRRKGGLATTPWKAMADNKSTPLADTFTFRIVNQVSGALHRASQTFPPLSPLVLLTRSHSLSMLWCRIRTRSA